jgi:hypothetical protein
MDAGCDISLRHPDYQFTVMNAGWVASSFFKIIKNWNELVESGDMLNRKRNAAKAKRE